MPDRGFFTATPMPTSSVDGRIPILVGITGHRDPVSAKRDALEASVTGILGDIQRAAPNSPLVLLTPLARGCDRIAAHAAIRLRQARRELNVRVVAVLPLPLDDYRRDFAADPSDAAEFEELLGACDEVFVLPCCERVRKDEHGFVSAGPDRDLHYRRLGLYLALQSHLMVAMWNGVRNGKVGGTAEVVDFCLGRRPRDFNSGIPFRRASLLLAAPDTTPVLCIPTLRESVPDLVDSGLSPASGGLSTGVRSDIRDLEMINVGLLRIKRSARRPEMFEIPVPEAVDAPWKVLEDRFLRLDALAQEGKKLHVRCTLWIASIAAAGVCSFQWFSSYAGGYPRQAWISLVAYVALFVVAVLLWWYSVRVRRVEWTFVHARALAEAMRVQIAWCGSGVDEFAPDQYLARRQGDVRFLRNQLRAALLECAIISSRGGIERGSEVGIRWAREQVSYFDPTARPMQRRLRNVRLQQIVVVLLSGAVGAFSLFLLVISILEAARSEGSIDAWADAGCLSVGVSLALAVAFGYWRDVMLDGEDLESAARMRQVFEQACGLLARDPESAREVLRALGKEALDEHADWFSRHREKLRIPEAG